MARNIRGSREGFNLFVDDEQNRKRDAPYALRVKSFHKIPF